MNIRCFGTDDEQALHDAFHHEFPHSIHLLCSIHVRRNLKSKLRELGVDSNTIQVVLGDIFGRQIDTQHLERLVDADSEKEYHRGLEKLCKKWEKLDSNRLHSFASWFREHYNTKIKKSLLRSKRKQARLGDPPAAFTTNTSESVNALLKTEFENKQSDIPTFITKLEAVIDEQDRELERAIIDSGKYRFAKQFKHFVKTERQWFHQMSITQRQTHLHCIANAVVKSSDRLLIPSSTSNEANTQASCEHPSKSSDHTHCPSFHLTSSYY